MKRPIIKIEKEPIDWLLEGIALFGLLILIALPMYFYNTLPETIPIHFDIKGQPDGFGDKKMLWLLPAIGVFVYLLLTVLNKHPHNFNHPVKITEENAFDQYRGPAKLLRWLKVIILIFFAIMKLISF